MKPIEKLYRIFDTSDAGSVFVASEIASMLRLKQAEGKNLVLGLATGSTPVTVYKELVRLHQHEGLSFKNLVSFNLDEYYPMAPDSLQSYRRFMQEHLFDYIDALPENIHIPDGTLLKSDVSGYCQQYEADILAAGGIDLQILGIGRTGHVGFNEPGSRPDSRTRLITLDHVTRLDAASDFFSEEYVPRTAITMGVGTILDARRIILMAWGEGKSRVIKKAIEGPVTDQIAASFLQNHPDALFVLDEAAAADLTSVHTPWLIGDVDWTEQEIKRAVIWLSQLLNKPILKLTNADYNENGLSGLLTDHGSAYNINIRIFNRLQHTITGWPGGKPNADDSHRPERANPFPKKVIIFSPHPDDDVISMGGTFIRLVDQGHDVHVAYQTSGNIAVFDEDVIRFADFSSDLSQVNPDYGREEKSLLNLVSADIRNKQPGAPDSPLVQKMKALIRRGEAKAACRYVGIPASNAHFLDMPFYETGRVKKKDLGPEDIAIVADLMQKLKPHQIFAAGDLSDPHGTHRVCLLAIFSALEELKNEAWMQDCRVWLYRGAWQEWGVDQIDMAVPLSPEELMRKRRAVFKHQSQKDSAMFPGHDAREFWQRAEDRNQALAAQYNNLGLAEYEAMEAFKRYFV